MAAWWLDDMAAVFDARERAFHLYRRRGETRGAGRVCLERGDAATAERLVERYLRQAHPADHTERMRGLEALIRARVALGNSRTAEEAFADLRAIAELI